MSDHRTVSLPPGVHPEVSMEDYLDLDAWSASTIHTLLTETPGHAKYQIDHPDKNTSTDARTMGSLFHLAVLEPQAWARHRPQPPGRNDKAKQEIIDAGFVPVPNRFWDPIQDMLEGVKQKKKLQAILARPYRTELTVVVDLKHQGQTIRCKLRPDIDSDFFGVTGHLKTAINVSDAAFSRQAYRLGYHRTLAFYRRGMAALGLDRTPLLIVCEKRGPYPVRLLTLTNEALSVADSEIDTAFDMILRCREAGMWPTYPDEIEELLLPIEGTTLQEVELEEAEI